MGLISEYDLAKMSYTEMDQIANAERRLRGPSLVGLTLTAEEARVLYNYRRQLKRDKARLARLATGWTPYTRRKRNGY